MEKLKFIFSLKTAIAVIALFSLSLIFVSTVVAQYSDNGDDDAQKMCVLSPGTGDNQTSYTSYSTTAYCYSCDMVLTFQELEILPIDWNNPNHQSDGHVYEYRATYEAQDISHIVNMTACQSVNDTLQSCRADDLIGYHLPIPDCGGEQVKTSQSNGGLWPSYSERRWQNLQGGWTTIY